VGRSSGPCRVWARLPQTGSARAAFRVVSHPAEHSRLATVVPRFTAKPDSAINDCMNTQELISKEVESLPEPLQQEVYDFARFLRLKSNGELQLLEEFESWEAASDEDGAKLERNLAEVE
jgi:Protein of unknown function (DUF2281)